MPKRWKVTYAGAVFEAINGPDSSLFSSLTARSPEREVEADDLQVEGGALVFSTHGEPVLVFGPDAYWLVEKQDDYSTTAEPDQTLGQGPGAS
jgi:hypothetical protein